eukprot:gene7266-7479_t
MSDGRCFLCSCPVLDKQPHQCCSVLWRLLVVDQTQLWHANPAEVPGVLLAQDPLLKIRQQCHLVVQVVFMCPPHCLPSSLADKQQEMASNGSWPLLRFLMVIGPSSFVLGERGAFALAPPDHQWTERQKGSMFQQQLEQQHLQRSRDRMTAPTVTRSLAGCYIGFLRKSQLKVMDSGLAVTNIAGTSWFWDPTLDGAPEALQGLDPCRVADMIEGSLEESLIDREIGKPHLAL